MALLQNHIAVITGAASGIGRAIASGYAREGARVVLLDVNEKAASGVAEEIRDGSGKADSFALDVTRREDCDAVARQIADKVGQVSILVNNAGIARRTGMLGARDPGRGPVGMDHAPRGRERKPEAILGAAIFLASDLSSYVPGSRVMVDGGYSTI